MDSTAATGQAGAPSSRELPEFFKEMLAAQYGSDLAAAIESGCAVRRRTTLRANSLKASADEVAGLLSAAGIAWESVPWYGDAFVLPAGSERQVQEMPAFEDGLLYLQSLSSMLPPLVLAPRSGADVLDMCAAPGGKTSQMAALSGGSAHITACELHGPRAERLAFNLERQGASGVTVMRTDARRLDDYFSFDQILVDAPCSGSGTLRLGDPKMAGRFTPTLIQKSVKAQEALLAKALRLLKPGGRLVYSTCSVLACENEDVVERCLRAASKTGSYRIEPIDLADGEDMPRLPVRLEGALALCPTERYEGFFVAAVRRLA